MSNDIIERACAAAWNLKANRPWAEITEEWKPFYREQMRAALEAIQPLIIVTTAEDGTQSIKVASTDALAQLKRMPYDMQTAADLDRATPPSAQVTELQGKLALKTARMVCAEMALTSHNRALAARVAELEESLRIETKMSAAYLAEGRAVNAEREKVLAELAAEREKRAIAVAACAGEKERAEKAEATDAEINACIAAFQDRVRDAVIDMMVAHKLNDDVDGSGSDGGWDDLTLAEVGIGLNRLGDALTAARADAERHITTGTRLISQREQLGKALCSLMGMPFPPSLQDIEGMRAGLAAVPAPDPTAADAAQSALEALRVFAKEGA